MKRCACYRMGNADDADDVLQGRGSAFSADFFRLLHAVRALQQPFPFQRAQLYCGVWTLVPAFGDHEEASTKL